MMMNGYYYPNCFIKDDHTCQIYLLCIGFFDEGYPEFSGVFASCINHVTTSCGQQVIYVDVGPVAEAPETKVNDASVARAAKRLVVWDNLQGSEETFECIPIKITAAINKIRIVI